MWVNGGFKAGCFNTLQLAKQELTSVFSPGEREVADRGYNDENSLLFLIDISTIVNYQRLSWQGTKMSILELRFLVHVEMFRHGWQK